MYIWLRVLPDARQAQEPDSHQTGSKEKGEILANLNPKVSHQFLRYLAARSFRCLYARLCPSSFQRCSRTTKQRLRLGSWLSKQRRGREDTASQRDGHRAAGQYHYHRAHWRSDLVSISLRFTLGRSYRLSGKFSPHGTRRICGENGTDLRVELHGYRPWHDTTQFHQRPTLQA